MFFHEEAEEISDYLGGWYFDPLVIMPLGMLILALIADIYDPDALAATFAAMVVTSPIWLPLFLFVMFWKRWIHYIRFRSWFSQPTVLLHIELPPEVTKSPAAMEIVLIGLHNTGGEGTFIQRIWHGRFMPVHSLELVCNEGSIGYYLQVRRGWKDFTEARIYGQFPEARITEVEDYVHEVHFNNEEYSMWGNEYEKNDVGAVPIKTYIDWALDKNTDTPEVTTEPLTNIFELMSTIGPGEYYWIQFIIKARRNDQWYGFPRPGSGKRFANEGADKIKKITEGAIKRAQSLIKGDEAKARAAERGTAQLTEGERFAISAIERSMAKHVFDCGIRTLYISKKDRFNPTRIGQTTTLFAAFKGANSLAPTRGQVLFTYPWQDWNDVRTNLVKRKLFFWYKYRAYFYVPIDQNPVMMTTEELATLWHFPNSSVKTPMLQRVPTRVSEAPTNLPTAPPVNLPQ